MKARKITRKLYQKAVKPAIFRMHPDKVHDGMLRGVAIAEKIPFLYKVGRSTLAHNHFSLEQTLHGVVYRNPIGISAGFDKNAEFIRTAQMIGCGFTTCGSMTRYHRKGNDHPWFHRLPKTKSLVVHVGLANYGIEANHQRLLKRPEGFPVTLSLGVVTRDDTCGGDETIQDTVSAIAYALEHNLADVIEINVSCPNVHDEQPFTNPKLLKKLLSAADEIERDVPFYIKMPHDRTWLEFEKMLDEIVQHNIQGVVLCNLVKDRSKVKLQDPLSDDIKGGLSGAPTFDHSNFLIKKTYQKYGDRLTIIGVGGVFTAEDAYTKICFGASLVGMITGLIFEGPQVVGEINAGLEKLLEKDGFASIDEAVGSRAK